MRPILRVEIMPNAEYERVRDEIRGRVIAAKKARRVHLGEDMSGLFENRDTVHLQIQEMLRTEGITTESAIQHELTTYNELVPADGELSLTLYVEIVDKERRDRVLVELAGLELAVHVEVSHPAASGVDCERFTFGGKREGASDARTTAVHYLKARLSPAAVGALRAGGAKVAVVIDHPRYGARAELGAETLASLAQDLA